MRSAPHPDALILDVMLPELDGYEVLRQLRDDARTAKTTNSYAYGKRAARRP